GLAAVRGEAVRDAPLGLFDGLAAGVVLFIDTRRTVKTDGEVPWIYNQVLPRLGPGVVVHLHDAVLPGDYPEEWVLEGRAWNELYLLQSFLVFNYGFAVVFGVRWMIQHHRDALLEAFPALEPENPLAGALWIRRL